LKSKFKGACKLCGKSIEIGQEIVWSAESGARHPNCNDELEFWKEVNADIKRGITPLEGCPF